MKAKRMIRHMAVILCVVMAAVFAVPKVTAAEEGRTVRVGYYDAILMNIQMPVMNGYDASRRIREMEDPAKSSIPVLAVTANAFEEDKTTALDAGMNEHLAKPYDIPKIMNTLAQVLKDQG